jgi:hypothetical protein
MRWEASTALLCLESRVRCCQFCDRVLARLNLPQTPRPSPTPTNLSKKEIGVWASENFEAFIALRSSQPGDHRGKL